MTKYHYKNETNADIAIIGVGVIKAGETLDTEVLVENPNITLVDAKPVSKKSVNKEQGDVE